MCFYIHSLGRGGAEHVVANLAETFCIAGNEVSIITAESREKEYALDKRIKRYILTQHSTKHRLLRNLQELFLLRQCLNKVKPDVLIALMSNANIQAILSRFLSFRQHKMKVIISVRNVPQYEYYGRLLSFLAKKLLPKADGCVFQTPEAQQWFSPTLQKKSVIIYNPVHKDFYTKTCNIESNSIITCGRLVIQKRQSLLISAFAFVVKRYPDCKLYIYGDGDLRQDLQKQIDALHLSESAFMLGCTDNVAAALSKSEIFVLSSDFEGMPNALMEAMAVGLPCISTDCPCGGPRALLEDGKNGILVPVGDAQAMAQAIITLLDNPELRETYSKNAKAAAGNFTQEKIYEQWMSYINEILEKN